MQTDPVLWQTLNAYDLDAADAALPFSRRLGRDNGWSRAYAQRAIAEYKRFIYLVCVSGHTCTPSEDVDAVWHLHLIYTRDYWDRLCAETLKRRIDHGPTKGGQAEAEKYLDCYRRTLRAYETEFGTPPPSDIWPDESIRFGRPDRYQRIDKTQVFTLPKRQVFLCLTIGAVAGLMACTRQEALTIAATIKPAEWLAIAFIFIVIWMCLASAFTPRKPNRKKDDGGCGSSCGTSCGSDSGGHGGGHGCGSGCGSGCGGGCSGGCGGH